MAAVRPAVVSTTISGWLQAPATKLILLKEPGRTPQPSEFAIPCGESES